MENWEPQQAFSGRLRQVRIKLRNHLAIDRKISCICTNIPSANDVGGGSTTGSIPTYQLSNINAYCDYLTVSPEFNQLISDRLAQGPLPLVFSNYQSQLCGPTTSLSTSNRISTNAACVESVMYTWLKTSHVLQSCHAGLQEGDIYCKGWSRRHTIVFNTWKRLLIIPRSFKRRELCPLFAESPRGHLTS